MRVSAGDGGSSSQLAKLINNLCEALARKSKHACAMSLRRKSSEHGLEGEGGKVHAGRQNSVEACGERRISAAAGTNANDVHASSTRFAAGRLRCDPHFTSVMTAH
jgi:hypothetical protein